METQLDNPVWGALISQHVGFAQGTSCAKRYQPGIVAFAACSHPGRDTMDELNPWIRPGESFYIIGELPRLPPDWSVEGELKCQQMVLREVPGKMQQPILQEGSTTVSQLNETDAKTMFALMHRVQPGYFQLETHRLGNYYGIKLDGQLVAMAGERMRLTGYTELSAIGTHPHYAGQGHAQRLISQICHLHASQDTVSFLHVAMTNQRAIRLYEHLNFVQRRAISFHLIRKNTASPELTSVPNC